MLLKVTEAVRLLAAIVTLVWAVVRIAKAAPSMPAAGAVIVVVNVILLLFLLQLPNQGKLARRQNKLLMACLLVGNHSRRHCSKMTVADGRGRDGSIDGVRVVVRCASKIVGKIEGSDGAAIIQLVID
jgi:hypothetical protein